MKLISISFPFPSSMAFHCCYKYCSKMNGYLLKMNETGTFFLMDVNSNLSRNNRFTCIKVAANGKKRIDTTT